MGKPGFLEHWKGRVKQLKVEVYALYLAYRDPRVPWYAKALIACLVGYIFSPIDLIPDFIPVLGYLDDLVLVPLGIILVVRMIPGEVLEECREGARAALLKERPKNWIGAGVIVIVWLLLALWIVLTIRAALQER